MVSKGISTVTALMLLAHSVWGCCWHHAHDEPSHRACLVTHADQGDATIGHEHGQGGCSHMGTAAVSHGESPEQLLCHHDAPEDDGHHHGRCDESRCSFVNTSSAGIDGFWSVWAAMLPAADVPVMIAAVGHHLEADHRLPPLSAQTARALSQCWLL